ncbi:hypothetical protein ccrud_12680 [Corynebacterium crudilactis]|uniref:Polyketide cyclase n=1 Tax=Corynebacterium crudilactis TaxID=1652495 RepID=A0A172QXQ2_9CORY|nr:hypothetical protein ccrud_12680 [Corynebacterium crudilactis]
MSVLSSASPEKIYKLARDLSKLPAWASGLATGSLTLIDANSLELDSPMGRVHTEFSPINSCGILDHTVILPDGTKVLNPFRVIPHPTGSELIFTVRPSENFEEDCQAVSEDLERLVSLVESA